MPEIPVSTMTGSVPHVPTFCVLGTRAPNALPIGMLASSPSTITHTTPDTLRPAHQGLEPRGLHLLLASTTMEVTDG